MEYKRPPPARPKLQPRVIIHGGAGNLSPATLPPERYAEFRTALLTIISKTHTYMTTPTTTTKSVSGLEASEGNLPSSLDVATHAVTLLEDHPLFNAARGAVFTRDGVNECEASVMVSRGRAKRGVGVSGLRHVRNPILLAREVLVRGEGDLRPRVPPHLAGGGAGVGTADAEVEASSELNVPSAQGHTHIYGPTAESLASLYNLPLVHHSYFFTQPRWDEHIRGLAREKQDAGLSASWSRDEYLPQGTVGAVALDADGVLCCATSTGGLTNKLTGRVGDTPTVGAGFWAEEWLEQAGRTISQGPVVELAGVLGGWVADCLPSPWIYTPLLPQREGGLVTTRSVAVSGTGNGDSFLRTGAARTVGAIARFAGKSGAAALTQVTGPGGELQRSAGDRWKLAGEGEGGMIGIECVVVRDGEGNVVEARSELLKDFNCNGMFRAWVDDRGVAFARVFREEQELALPVREKGF